MINNNKKLRTVKNISINLYRFFGELSKSNEEIADELNLSVRTIYNYMNGARIPNTEMLIKLADYLGKKVDDLLL